MISRLRDLSGKIFSFQNSGNMRFGPKSVHAGHLKVTYRGVVAQRNPFDYVIYQMILSELKPDLVIEIGTNFGGGALYLADLMNNFGHGFVHSIDIEKKTGSLVENHPRIKLFLGGWQGYDLQNAVGFSKILVIDDGSHEYKDCFGALKKFAPVVTPGSYFIMEDGIINRLGQNWRYQGGPLKAIKEFLAANNGFYTDRKWCDMFGHNATSNIDGYLKKKV